MSARPPATKGWSLASALDSSLRAAAEGIERYHDGHSNPPPELEGEDEIDGVYDSPVARIIDGFRAQLKRGDPFDMPLRKLYAILDALFVAKLEGGVDDRKYLLEHGLTFLSRYPADTVTAKELQDKVIALLWYDLAHPPASVVGSKYQFRTADGSGTSIWHPDMGKAGTPYARSVQGRHPLAKNQLPSPELLFDSLLKREEDPAPHPAGLSTFFFAFANLVIHSLFWTTFEDPGEEEETDFSQPINKVSSYLDLSPLYGSSEKELDSIRLKDGTGRIHPDTFADPRVLRMPLSTPALLIMFSRNHNYIAEKLLDINERGRWQKPPPDNEKKRRKQDDEIFGTARLVNCGWFMSTIFGDYLASILGLVREGNSWSLDPLSNFREASHEIVERGSGNIVSIEFLALYHFHSSIGVQDEKWAENAMADLVGHRNWDAIDITEYREALKREREKPRSKAPPTMWPLGPYQRVNGRFNDEDLAKILHDATEQYANAFKARGTPHVMRLYRHPDNIELYVGLQAEQSKEKRPGAGLCPGFTMSRAILADAVALVRGDRFLTNDFTASNLTAWGIQDCTRDPKNSSNGGMMGKLLGRCLPNHFPVDSLYTNFPFVVPKEMQKFLADVHQDHLYTTSRPVPSKLVETLKGYYEVFNTLNDRGLASTVPHNASIVLQGGGYLASYDEDRNSDDKKLIADAFLPSQKQHLDFLERTTAKLLQEKSYTLADKNKRSVNIVRDVINILPVYFISEHVLGLPLKTSDNTDGSDLDQEVYLKFKEVYEFIFVDIAEPSTKVAKEESMKIFSQYFQDSVQEQIEAIASEQIPLLGHVVTALHGVTRTHHESHEWLKRLLIAGWGKTREELGNDATALAIALSVEFSQALTHVVDTFLGPTETGPSAPKAEETEPSLAKEFKALNLNSSDKDATTALEKVITKALRIRPPLPGTYRKVVQEGVEISNTPKPEKDDKSKSNTPKPEKNNQIKIKAMNERVYLSFTEAGVDAAVWGKKSNVSTTSANASTKQGTSPEPLIAGEIVRLLGPKWLPQALVPVIKTMFRLKDIKRAKGNSGKLLSFNELIEGTPVTTYLNYKQEPTFWSSDLTVTYTS
ncbi:hypothetical protein FS837_011455 [Tulasnella sp. UAMH 9824]|nr:hypothetical protein FS837_011455 [Tulasnella sp. UAMH 9824]